MVLDRVMDIINHVNSLVPIEQRSATPELENILTEIDPIDDSKYPDFPFRPTPAPPPPFDLNNEKLRQRLREILSLFDETEAKTLHELTNHSIIGKVLHLLYCLLTSIPYTPARLKQFFKKEKILQLMIDFDPHSLKKRKIRELKNLIVKYSYLNPVTIDKISHSSVLILEFVKTVALVIEEVPIPKPYSRNSIIEESVYEAEYKPLVYRPGVKPKSKIGKFLNPAEMVINETFEVIPAKIGRKLSGDSEEELNFSNNYSNRHIGRYSSLDYNNNFAGVSKKTIIIKKIFEMSKFRIVTSKKSIEESSRNLKIDDELLDKVGKIQTNRDSLAILDLKKIETEALRHIRLENIDKHPTSTLIKFAEILKERRENHSLL